MRCLIVMLAIVLAAFTSAQSVAWSHTLPGSEARMTTDASGNIYVATINLRPISNTYLIVDKFAPTGEHLDHDVSSWAYTQVDWVRIMGMKVAGGTIKLLLNISANSNYSSALITYDMTTGAISSAFPLKTGASAATNLHSLAIGVNTYAVSGVRSSDGELVIQRRSLLSNAITSEPTLGANPKKPGECIHIGGDDYLANMTFSSGGLYFHLMVEFGSTLSFTSVPAPFMAQGVPKLVLSNDGTIAWSAFVYDDGGATQANVRIQPFRISSFGFLGEQDVASTGDDDLFDLYPLGDSNVIVCGRRGAASETFVNTYTTTAPIFATLVAGNGSNDSGLVRSDSGGNIVCLAGKFDFTPYHLFVGRYHPLNAAILNTYEVGPATTCSPIDATVDSAGRIRTLLKIENGNEVSWQVAQIDPAGLSIPGPYTIGGDTAIGTITLGSPAPALGATFDLFSNNTAATVPATVTIPSGALSQTFTINTTPVAANAKPVITARYAGLNVQANFDLAAPLVQSVSANPQSQYGGVNIVGTVRLTGDAPTGGKIVALSSSNTAKATVAASTTIAAGANAKTFTIVTVPTLVNASSVITATTGAVSKTVFIAINAPVLLSATLAQNSIKGGLSTTMTPILNAKAPSGYSVTLLSGSQLFVQLPSSFAIPAGTVSVNIPVTTSSVSTTTPITLVAYRGPYVKTMTLTLTP